MNLQGDPKAQKILKEEGIRLEELTTSLFSSNLDSPHKVLLAIGKLFNSRQRYFGKTGEFFSVRELLGINMVDTLDDKLVMFIVELIKHYKNRCEEEPELLRPIKPKAERLVKAAIKKNLKPIPEYPVAYIMLYTLQLAFEAFDPIISEPPDDFTPIELETVFLEEIQKLTEIYVADRSTKLTRHLCDVAREYSVVTRLKCKCENGEFEVAKQTLNTDTEGKPYDKLEIKCKFCGDERSLEFALPNFTDLQTKN